MNAYKVFYNSRSREGDSIIILAVNKGLVKYELEKKSPYRYENGNPHCYISSITEIPFSQVLISDLSIVEFIELKESGML